MKSILASLMVVVSSTLLIGTALAKPDKVDGINVPSGRIPQEIKDNRYPRTYFPGTEKLAKDEMRITALGTGMPNQSSSNVAASFLVELGNGDSFLFDLGTDLGLEGGVGGEYAMEANEMEPGTRDQGSQALQEFQRRHHDMRSAIAVRVLS